MKGRWSAVALVVIGLASPLMADDLSTRNAAMLEKLQLRLLQAQAEHRRWQRVIDVQQDLTRNPNKFSQAAVDASHSLKASGTDLVIEGLTGGLSGYLELNSELITGHDGEQLKRRFELAADGVEAISANLIKGHLGSNDNESLKPSEANDSAIEKVQTILSTAADAISDPALKEAASASVQIHAAAFQFLNAYYADDEPGMAKYLPAVRSMLQVTLKAVTSKGTAAAALTGDELLLAALNVGIGGFGLAEGFALSAEAEEIRDRQMEAAVRLNRLLPRARIEVARAVAAELQLAREIAALGGNAPSMSRTVQPSEHFVDDAVGTPQSTTQAFDIVASMDDGSGLQSGFTPQGLSLLASDFERRTEEARARERARAIAEQQARWAAEQEQENARERAQWQAEQQYVRERSYNSYPRRSNDFGAVRNRVYNIESGILSGRR